MDSFLIPTIRISRYNTKWIGPLMLLREKRNAFQAWEFPHEPILWVALYEHSKCKLYQSIVRPSYDSLRSLKKEKWDDLRMDDKYKLMKMGTASANFEASINSLWRLINPYQSLINESTLKGHSGAI